MVIKRKQNQIVGRSSKTVGQSSYNTMLSPAMQHQHSGHGVVQPMTSEQKHSMLYPQQIRPTSSQGIHLSAQNKRKDKKVLGGSGQPHHNASVDSHVEAIQVKSQMQFKGRTTQGSQAGVENYVSRKEQAQRNFAGAQGSSNGSSGIDYRRKSQPNPR